MSKLIIPVLFIGCCIYYGCNEDYSPPIIIQDEPTEPDSCYGINPVACDFEFREGKWLEIQDSIDAIYYIPDTIWFIEDSLIGWAFGGDPYRILTGYFQFNQIYTQPWNSGGQGPVSSTGVYTTYNDTTGYFRIHWFSQTNPFNYADYEKID